LKLSDPRSRGIETRMIAATQMALDPAAAVARANGLRVLVLDCSMATAEPTAFLQRMLYTCRGPTRPF
jgi:hypothetical protein